MGDFEQFKVLHEAQLKSNDIPEHLLQSLCKKLQNQVKNWNCFEFFNFQCFNL